MPERVVRRCGGDSAPVVSNRPARRRQAEMAGVQRGIRCVCSTENGKARREACRAAYVTRGSRTNRSGEPRCVFECRSNAEGGLLNISMYPAGSAWCVWVNACVKQSSTAAALCRVSASVR